MEQVLSGFVSNCVFPYQYIVISFTSTAYPEVDDVLGTGYFRESNFFQARTAGTLLPEEHRCVLFQTELSVMLEGIMNDSSPYGPLSILCKLYCIDIRSINETGLPEARGDLFCSVGVIHDFSIVILQLRSLSFRARSHVSSS